MNRGGPGVRAYAGLWSGMDRIPLVGRRPSLGDDDRGDPDGGWPPGCYDPCPRALPVPVATRGNIEDTLRSTECQ